MIPTVALRCLCRITFPLERELAVDILAVGTVLVGSYVEENRSTAISLLRSSQDGSMAVQKALLVPDLSHFLEQLEGARVAQNSKLFVVNLSMMSAICE